MKIVSFNGSNGENIKFDLTAFGFNSHNFLVPSEPLNRVATVYDDNNDEDDDSNDNNNNDNNNFFQDNLIKKWNLDSLLIL